MRAFALMRLASELEAAWLASPRYGQYRELLDRIRSAVGVGDVRRYRGIGRFPLTEWPEAGPGWQGESPSDDADGVARALLLERLGSDDYLTAEPRSFVTSQESAREIQRALHTIGRYEVVELATGTDVPARPLGFDVGYWGGGNFSILCDTVIWPTWHPPADDTLGELSRHVATLNESLLFPSTDDANAFRSWYSAQSWAEAEPEEFEIIAVGELPAGG